ncbi:MAG: 8-oxo-dGTP diphosphatase MutT [Robiginitomaculum sp.]|nr:8-oxo-dGTP diphosphatase MutT [Robiginitomaculum sp.]
MKILLVVAGALVDADGRVLITQRPAGKQWAGKWEFPGGKIHAGETPEAALVRELREELSIDPCESCLQSFAFSSVSYPDFHLLLALYVCRQWDGIVRAAEGQALKWVKPDQLHHMQMPPADIPLAAEIRDRLRR